MPSVNVSFLGVCTIFQDLPKQVPPGSPIDPNFPLSPNRVVLVKNTTKLHGIDPHVAKIQFVADHVSVQGHPLPPVDPPVNGVFSLAGVTLSIVNPASGGSPLAFSLGCLPSLQAQLKPPAQLGPPKELVYNPDPTGAAAWFDVSAGNSWDAYLMCTIPTCETVPSISILNIETNGSPQLLVTPWDGGASTIITLTREGKPPDINVSNFADGKAVIEDNRDFLLNYLTAATFPALDSVNIPQENVCNTQSPLCYNVDGCGDAGPGCSNTNFP